MNLQNKKRSLAFMVKRAELRLTRIAENAGIEQSNKEGAQQDSAEAMRNAAVTESDPFKRALLHSKASALQKSSKQTCCV